MKKILIFLGCVAVLGISSTTFAELKFCNHTPDAADALLGTTLKTLGVNNPDTVKPGLKQNLQTVVNQSTQSCNSSCLQFSPQPFIVGSSFGSRGKPTTNHIRFSVSCDDRVLAAPIKCFVDGTCTSE